MPPTCACGIPIIPNPHHQENDPDSAERPFEDRRAVSLRVLHPLYTTSASTYHYPNETFELTEGQFVLSDCGAGPLLEVGPSRNFSSAVQIYTSGCDKLDFCGIHHVKQTPRGWGTSPVFVGFGVINGHFNNLKFTKLPISVFNR